MKLSSDIIPFRWNIDKENELGALSNGISADISGEFLEELISSSARIMAFAGDSTLYFVGRSPESYFDFLSGIYNDDKKIIGKINLFQFSGRRHTIEELTTKYFSQLENLKIYMTHIGLSPLQIIKRKTNTAFIDVVYQGQTFEILFQILKKWTEDLKADWNAVRNKVRIVGITERTKNSPNTWRWQQQVEWINLVGSTVVKNVSVSLDFWRYIANEQFKTTKSFYPDRWNDSESSEPIRSEFNIEGLKLALAIHKFGRDVDSQTKLRKQLVKQKELEHNWFKQYVKVLPS